MGVRPSRKAKGCWTRHRFHTAALKPSELSGLEAFASNNGRFQSRCEGFALPELTYSPPERERTGWGSANQSINNNGTEPGVRHVHFPAEPLI